MRLLVSIVTAFVLWGALAGAALAAPNDGTVTGMVLNKTSGGSATGKSSGQAAARAVDTTSLRA